MIILAFDFSLKVLQIPKGSQLQLKTSPTHPCQTSGTGIVSRFAIPVPFHVRTEFSTEVLTLPYLDSSCSFWSSKMIMFVMNLWSNSHLFYFRKFSPQIQNTWGKNRTSVK